jgi:pyruvate kinase
MNLLWGVHPVRRGRARSSEDMVAIAERDLVQKGEIGPGDVLGVVAGTQMSSGSTNFMRFHVVTASEVNQALRSGKRSRSRES